MPVERTTQVGSESKKPERGLLPRMALILAICVAPAAAAQTYVMNTQDDTLGSFHIGRHAQSGTDFIAEFELWPNGACAGRPITLGGDPEDFMCMFSGGLFDCGPALGRLGNDEKRSLDRINVLPGPGDTFNVFYDAYCEIDGDTFTDFGQTTARRALCQPDPNTLCLQDNRFRVLVDWRNTVLPTQIPASTGPDLTDDSGTFFFTDPANIEFLVKVIDACDFNDHYWVFAAGATDVEYTLTVTDLVTNQNQVYGNTLGNPSVAVTDTSAFATCP